MNILKLIFGWFWKAKKIKHVIESPDSHGNSSEWAKTMARLGKRVKRNMWPEDEWVVQLHGVGKFWRVKGGVVVEYEFKGADEASCDWIVVL